MEIPPRSDQIACRLISDRYGLISERGRAISEEVARIRSLGEAIKAR